MPGRNEIKELRKQLRQQGFDVAPARNGHWQVVAPNGRKCQIPSTPKGGRTLLNVVTRLRRIGFRP